MLWLCHIMRRINWCLAGRRTNRAFLREEGGTRSVTEGACKDGGFMKILRAIRQARACRRIIGLCKTEVLRRLGTRAAGSTRRRTIGLRKTDILRRGGPWSSRFLNLVILSGGASPRHTIVTGTFRRLGTREEQAPPLPIWWKVYCKYLRLWVR